jgi:hypothetical protein
MYILESLAALPRMASGGAFLLRVNLVVCVNQFNVLTIDVIHFFVEILPISRHLI